MKTNILSSIFLFAFHITLFSNPVDITPLTRFSELIFQNDNDWTIELEFPYYYENWAVRDSIVIETSDSKAKVNANLGIESPIGIITQKDLSDTLSINKNGDIIKISTYSYGEGIVRIDEILFGDYPNSSVGKPSSNFSIMRIIWEEYYNETILDYLTEHPSLGEVNDTTGRSGVMKGYIYDTNNNPVTKLREFPASPCYFQLHAPIEISADGSYTTKIFRRFLSEKINFLTVKLVSFYGWAQTVNVDTFQLDNIHPDTTVILDLHLLDDYYIETAVEKDNPKLEKNMFHLINYPNPFNSSTNFMIQIPEKYNRNNFQIIIYDSNGRFVKEIQMHHSETASWNGRNSNGASMPSGIYYYQLLYQSQMMKSGSVVLLR